MTGQCNSVLTKIVLDALETIGKDSEDQMHKKRIQKLKNKDANVCALLYRLKDYKFTHLKELSYFDL